jgi:PAS domain-containing protein
LNSDINILHSLQEVYEEMSRESGYGSPNITRNDIKGAENEENWMAEFLLNSPGPVLRIGSEGTVLYANKAGESLLKALNGRIGEKAPAEILKTARRVAVRNIFEQTELKQARKLIQSFLLLYLPAKV